jgi:hypothetical protein
MRLPTYMQLRRFVEVEGWENKDKKSRKKTGDHHRYVFTTPTGERLYTRISHGSGQIQDPELFTAILPDQLQIDRRQFWSAVDNGAKPRRAFPGGAIRPGSIDAKLARNLLTKAGVPSESLYEMSAEQALSLWHQWLEKELKDRKE